MLLLLSLREYGGCGIDNLQIRIVAVYLQQLILPAWKFECLVHDEHLSTVCGKLSGKINKPVPVEVEIVHTYQQALAQSWVEMLFRILQEEARAAHATWTSDTYHAIAPIYRIHKGAPRCAS